MRFGIPIPEHEQLIGFRQNRYGRNDFFVNFIVNILIDPRVRAEKFLIISFIIYLVFGFYVKPTEMVVAISRAHILISLRVQYAYSTSRFSFCVLQIPIQ